MPEEISDKISSRSSFTQSLQRLSKVVSTGAYTSVLKIRAAIVKDLRETPGSCKWNMAKPVEELKLNITFDKGFLIIVQSLRDSVYYVVCLSDVPKCESSNPNEESPQHFLFVNSAFTVEIHIPTQQISSTQVIVSEGLMIMAIKGIEAIKVNSAGIEGLLEISINTAVNHLSRYNNVLKNWATTVKDLRETPDSWVKWNMTNQVEEPRLNIIFYKGFLIVQCLRDLVCYVIDLSEVPKCGSYNAYGNEQMDMQVEVERMDPEQIQTWLSSQNYNEQVMKDLRDVNGKMLFGYSEEQLVKIVGSAFGYAIWNSLHGLSSQDKKRPSSYQLPERETKSIKRAEYAVNSVHAIDLSFPGLVPSSVGEVPLYFRPSSFKLFQDLFLPKSLFMVQGPPGSGKSSMTWAWASQLDSVCWIHLGDFEVTICATNDGDKWEKYTESHDRAIDVVTSCQSNNLILDGIVKDKHANLVSHAVAKWLIQGKKLVLVCSLQYVIKQETVQIYEVELLEMPSWTFQEYEAAYANQDFKKSIKKDVFPDGENDAEKLEDKYFVAGGSARWMFQFTLGDAIKDIEIQISKVGTDAQLLLKGLEGERSNTSISHLFCSLNKKPFIISEFVTRALAGKCEASFLTNARSSDLALNPSFDGWILEAEFLYQLRASEVKIYPRDSGAIHLPVASGIKFTNFSDIKSLPADNTWYIPMRWNQACFDSVQVLPGSGFRFIQVTRSKTHSLKKKYVVMFLDQFVDTLSMKVEFFEFWFVVPNQSEYDDFRPKIPEGSYGKYKSLLKMNDESEFSVVGFDRL